MQEKYGKRTGLFFFYVQQNYTIYMFNKFKMTKVIIHHHKLIFLNEELILSDFFQKRHPLHMVLSKLCKQYFIVQILIVSSIFDQKLALVVKRVSRD